MPIIPYRAIDFGKHYGSSFKGWNNLHISWQEMVWSAITMGKPGVAYLLAHGWHSVSDVIVRSHTVYANLRQNSDFIVKSSLYDTLDPTEKGAASYFVGMMAAKILSERLLKIPWLFHLSMFRSMGGVAVLYDKSEPDLIGLNTRGEWVVVEAKGRSHGYSDSAMVTAKRQTRQLRMINGSYPVLRVGIQSYFSPKLSFVIIDPEEFDENARDIEFNLNSALRMYYSAAISWTHGSAETRSVDNRKFLVKSNDDVGITVGLDIDIKERFDANKPIYTIEKSKQVEGTESFDNNFTVFPDGLAIGLDGRWSDKRMKLDPRERKI